METKEAIFGRRSIRKYTEKPISDKDLQEIIEAGLCAPSGINLQPWFFVVVKSEEKKKELVEIMGNVFGKFRPVLEQRFSRNPEAIDETKDFLSGLGGAQICILAFLLKPDYEDTITVIEGTSAALENMLLMAYDKGIGSCWLTAPLKAGFGEELQNHFAPGKGKFLAAVTLGYPATTPKMPPRRPGRYEII